MNHGVRRRDYKGLQGKPGVRRKKKKKVLGQGKDTGKRKGERNKGEYTKGTCSTTGKEGREK